MITTLLISTVGRQGTYTDRQRTICAKRLCLRISGNKLYLPGHYHYCCKHCSRISRTYPCSILRTTAGPAEIVPTMDSLLDCLTSILDLEMTCEMRTMYVKRSPFQPLLQYLFSCSPSQARPQEYSTGAHGDVYFRQGLDLRSLPRKLRPSTVRRGFRGDVKSGH